MQLTMTVRYTLLLNDSSFVEKSLPPKDVGRKRLAETSRMKCPVSSKKLNFHYLRPCMWCTANAAS